MRDKQKIRVGITGQSGFIGSYLYNYIKLFPENYEVIDFDRDFFNDDIALQTFVSKCHVVVHLAGVNRHNSAEMIHDANINLATQLIKALECTGSKPFVIYSSSVQEHQENIYGKAKKEARLLFEQWAGKHGAEFCGMIIPNVFGPFGNPFYNSVIATFSYQLTHGVIPKIETDKNLPLIYVGELVEKIRIIIDEKSGGASQEIPETNLIKVSEVLDKLTVFKTMYLDKNTIPKLSNVFEINLFNTFRSYIDIGQKYPVPLQVNMDNRGYLVEIIKEFTGGQSFFSITKPSITRGNHYHTRKIERFCVLKGEALIKLRKVGSDVVCELYVSGAMPTTIDIPIWYVHNITNTGKDELLTLFWCNEVFDVNDTDTYFEIV